MNNQVKECLEKYPSEIVELFTKLRDIIFDSTSDEINETMWAKLPSYYVGAAFIRLIPFKDHINIEARAISERAAALQNYKITPKGMLQIFVDQDIPTDILKGIFKETLK